MMRLKDRLSNYAIFLALAIEFAVLALSTESFLTASNLSNVLRQNAFTAILAAGMTFVIITAGIDLSVGSVVGLTGVLCAGLLSNGAGVPAALAGALALGVGIGGVDGVAITQLKRRAVSVALED